MVVAIIALIVACAGTATAASVVLIKNSSQVKAGSLNGSDLKAKSIMSRNLGDGAVSGRAIKAGSVTGATLKKGSIGTDQLATSVRSALTSQGFTATEGVRKEGPTVPNGGQAGIAKIQGLAPGTYAIFAKVIVSPVTPSGGLVGELTNSSKTGNTRCTLDGAGDTDEAVAPIATPFALFANTLKLQLTRTLAAPSEITLTCDANG
jgi:hypothetical protein